MNVKAILITGGAKRVGAALSRYFASQGYDIALHYNHSEKEAKQLKAEIGGACTLFDHDLSDAGGIPALMERVHKTMPHCAALINNASIFERADFMATDEAMFDRQLAVNLKAPFFMTQAFARQFKKGSVINMLDSDIVSTQGSHFAYLLAKKALAEFTTMAARALGPAVRVNAVCPGPMLPSGEVDEAYMRRLEKEIPLKKLASLEDICIAAQSLLAMESVTGQFIYADGGQHLL